MSFYCSSILRRTYHTWLPPLLSEDVHSLFTIPRSKMEQPAFIFLNATGSSLSPPAAKRMRAHITKTNFAKRRQHAHPTRSEQKEQRKHQSQQLKESEEPKSNQLFTSLPPKSTSSKSARDATACKDRLSRAIEH